MSGPTEFFHRAHIEPLTGTPYRAIDVDDLILNTTGAALGWAGWHVTLGWLYETPDEASYLAYS